MWAPKISQDKERLHLCPGGAHSIVDTIHRSAKPGTWTDEASCLAGQEGQLRKLVEGLWEMAVSSGFSNKPSGAGRGLHWFDMPYLKLVCPCSLYYLWPFLGHKYLSFQRSPI